MHLPRRLLTILSLVWASIGVSEMCHAITPAAIGVARHVFWRAQNQNPAYRTQLNDISLYYELYGQGEPVLVLHGGTAFVETMHAQIRHLASRYTVIAPDLRGHGRSSDGSSPLSYDHMADDMVRLMDSLGIQNAHIVGYSDGGIIGLNMAFRYPNRVKKLAMISANFTVDGIEPGSLELIRNLTPSHPFVLSQGLFYQLVSSNPGHWPNMVEKIRQLWLTSPNFNIEQMSMIGTPTLSIVGEFDMVNPSHCEAFTSRIPGGRFVQISQGTHSIPIDRAPEVNSHLDSFL
jgi:pimeloyl-ACP methyl ester carboxylesterase